MYIRGQSYFGASRDISNHIICSNNERAEFNIQDWSALILTRLVARLDGFGVSPSGAMWDPIARFNW